MLYAIGIVIYVLIGIFLNPLFRKIIREDSSALKFKELEGSIFYSCLWPAMVAAIVLACMSAGIAIACALIYKLGSKLFNKKDG